MDTRTSAEWAAQRTGSRVVILDPDGWDRQHWTYSYFVEQISEREYERRLGLSTIEEVN
jgi:hypothetical protein